MYRTDAISDVIMHRASERIPFDELRKIGVTHFYVGGNSLNRGAPNDIDIYPIGTMSFFDLEFQGIPLLSQTKNATTLRLGGKIVQLCNYPKPSLKNLVDSFDYAHIQVGAEVKDKDIVAVYFTEAWADAHLLEDTWFTGSEYPLSSLLRAFKYQERGDFAGKSYISSVLSIVCAVVERGFTSYEDFKDQLDAVDLGLVPEDFDEVGRADLQRLYDVLTKGERRGNK